jgi:osmoprotectant transport system ATP-binding protein
VMIRLDGVGKIYPDGTTAVAGLSLEVRRGELLALVGPSGCGKSTILRMVNRLIQPTSGRILIDGVDVTDVDPVRLRRGIGYVIQAGGLFPHRRIRANVSTVPNLLGWDAARARARADELLEMVGLDPETFGDRYPHELSGGQQQRVGVARALAADPPVLLMDEPFGAVDPIQRDRLQDQFHAVRSGWPTGSRCSAPVAVWSRSTPRRRSSVPRPAGSWPTSSVRTEGCADWR